MEGYYSQIITDFNSWFVLTKNSSHIKWFHCETGILFLLFLLQCVHKKKRNVYNLLNMSYTSNYHSLELLIMGLAWLHEMDDVSLYPISWVELKTGDPISVSQSSQQDTFIRYGGSQKGTPCTTTQK